MIYCKPATVQNGHDCYHGYNCTGSLRLAPVLKLTHMTVINNFYTFFAVMEQQKLKNNSFRTQRSKKDICSILLTKELEVRSYY